MKKFFLTLIILLNVFTLVGCKDKSQVNVFDYSHKEPVEYKSDEGDSEIKNILRNAIEPQDDEDSGGN